MIFMRLTNSISEIVVGYVLNLIICPQCFVNPILENGVIEVPKKVLKPLILPNGLMLIKTTRGPG